MKPPDVTSVLLLGPIDSHKSSFLLQGAIHFAEQGQTVIYITATEFEKLPLLIQGQPRPSTDVLSLIKFQYLPKWQDLLHHLFSLHLHALIPSVIIVEALEHFYANDTSINSDASDASQTALICAALLDGAAVCASRSKGVAHLIVSVNQEVSQAKFSPLIDLFFTDVVWTIDRTATNIDHDGSGEYAMVNLETAGSQVRQYRIVFTPKSCEGAVVLKKVSFWDGLGRGPHLS